MSLLLLFHPRVAVNADAATVYLDLQPISTTEVLGASDAATVYLDIQPGFIYLQIDGVLEIVGLTTRWALGVPLARWTIETQPVARWRILDIFTRWAILETRRFHWKY